MGKETNLIRLPRLLALPCAVFLMVLSGSAAAHAAATSSGGPRPLAVSVPSDATPIAPGQTGSMAVRVVNPGTAPVTVTISGGTVQLGDDGRATGQPTPDPRWQGLAGFPPGPAGGSRAGLCQHHADDADARPDRRPRGRFASAMSALRRRSSGVRATRPRRRAARCISSGSTSSCCRWAAPVRSSFTGKPAWFVGFVTLKVHILYPDVTEAATKEVVLTKRVLVVDPIVLAVILAAVVVLLAWRIRRRRRRRRVLRGPAPRDTAARMPAHGPRHSKNQRRKARVRSAAR